jgi:DedD protein
MAEQQQDVDALKRRGRRRLVGAVALVLLAVIVLPMVFDPEPRRNVPPVSVRIPGENDSTFTPRPPKPAPAPEAAKAPAAKPASEGKPVPPAKPAAPEPEKPSEPKAVEKKAPATKPAPSEQARAEAALAGAQYIVPVGAFADADGVIAKLSAAAIPHYTEAAPGNLTRVRAGPFDTKEAADKAVERLKAIGLRPGRATTRPG